MSQAFDIARNTILSPAELDEQRLQDVLAQIVKGREVDSADLYFENSRYESWSLEDGIVKDGGYSIERGVGVRAISGEKTGFAYSDEFYLPALTEAAQSARAIARAGQDGSLQVLAALKRAPVLYPARAPFDSMAEEAKVALMESLDAEARRQDPRVKQVMVGMAASYQEVLVAASDGTLAADIRPLVRISVSVVVEDKGRREQGSSGGGARLDYGYFTENDRALGYAREAVRQALVNLDARAAPAGTMQVVLGPGWPGVLLHEAVGHGLEGDFNRKGVSAFSGRVGQKVASEHCTVVDDGTLADRRGSLNIDDEGVPSENTVLIENGILKGYIQDKMNARLMGVKPTGNGRRESYAHLPMPRMTNTYMLPGQHTPEEIIKSVKNGIYAVNFGGGQVDITSGKFVFSASEAYMIENGQVSYPIKGATLVGNGPDVMTRVSMVGNDLALDLGVGTCGKEGQSVPVGVGQPTLLLDGITVGGTST